jgi:hypothetical protein
MVADRISYVGLSQLQRMALNGLAWVPSAQA